MRPKQTHPYSRALPARFGALLRPAAAALALFALACGSDEPGATAVARVGDVTISVEEVADYMLRAGRADNVEAVRSAVDELVDIELLRQRARSEHALSPAESLQIREMEEIALINQFREEVVWATVAVDEAELRAWYEENVTEEARARHILVRFAPTATDQEKAAARAKADSLLAVARDGADFAELAREHSEDPGSAASGGMLEWFGRGQMVEPFEEAVFSSPAGEVVPRVVETPFGYHVIEVVERRRRPFEDLREEIEDQLAGPGRQQAEEAYVTRLMETSAIEFSEENVDRLIALVRSEEAPTAEEAARPLATFTGGVIPLGEIHGIFQVLPEGNRRAIAQLDQAGMISALSSVVRQRLLMSHAERENIDLDTLRQGQLDEQVDAIYMEAYLRGVAEQQLEVGDETAREYYEGHREFYQGQTYEEAADAIKDVLRTQAMQTLSAPDAQRQLVAAVADSQAQRVGVTVHEDAFEDVLVRLRELHEERGTQAPAEGPPPTAAPVPAPTGGQAPAGGEVPAPAEGSGGE